MKVIDGIVPESIFDKKKAEEIGPEGDGGDWKLFHDILEKENSKTGAGIKMMRQSHRIIQLIQCFYHLGFVGHGSNIAIKLQKE
jgi:hypothetical protein